MKLKKFLLATLITILALALIVFGLYLFPRLFGDTETKALYEVKGIMSKYVSFCSDDPIDFYHHHFSSGSYEYEDDKLLLWLYAKTDDDIMSVLSQVAELSAAMRIALDNNPELSEKDIELEVRIENRSNWCVTLKPYTDYISIGLTIRNPLPEVLGYCKDFEAINVGGYWGGDVVIPEKITADFFEDFEVLKSIKITDIQTREMERNLDEAIVYLTKKGVAVEIYDH